METRKLIRIIALVASILVTGCASSAKKNQNPIIEESVGTSLVVTQEQQGPAAPASTIKPVVLVLSPGAARAFAQAGVIRALTDAKIRIGAVLGTEVGALIGATYSIQPQMNAFEWQLQKIRETEFIQASRFLGIGQEYPMEAVALSKQLDQIFGNKSFKDLKIPLILSVEEKGAQNFALIKQGSLTKALRASIAIEGLLKEVQFENREVRASMRSKPYLVQEARALGIGPVILVDSLAYSSDRIQKTQSDDLDADLEDIEKRISQNYEEARDHHRSEREQADLVITPDVRSIGLLDFKRKNEAIYSGKQSVTALLPKIRELTGQAKP
ncbi:MAG: patatin-like phospholipase family protein [Bdellovibrionales bacterium]|nr:patatin-like phospholipase family protein [Bdellovibrionales bacterium]